MVDKVRTWSDPPKAIEILEVLDISIHESLASGAVIALLQGLYKEACEKEGTTNEEVVKGATWRGPQEEPEDDEPSEPSLQENLRRAVGALRYAARMFEVEHPEYETALAVVHTKKGEQGAPQVSCMLELDSFTDAILEAAGPGEPLPKVEEVVEKLKHEGPATQIDVMNEAIYAWKDAGDVASLRAMLKYMTENVESVGLTYHVNVLLPVFGFVHFPEFEKLHEAVRARVLRDGGEEKLRKLGLNRTKEEILKIQASSQAFLRMLGRY